MSRRPVTSTPAASAGEIFGLIKDGKADTRAEIARLTGLSRTAVTLRVNQLLEEGLVIDRIDGRSTGGRPPSRLEFQTGGGIVVAAALGLSRTQLAICDLAGEVIHESRPNVDLQRGPDFAVDAVLEELDHMLAESGVPADSIRGVGVSIPGPVEPSTGRSIMPPALPGWDRVAIAPLFSARLTAPVRVENDVNALALGERRNHAHAQVDDMLFIKVSTGIGAAVVSGGQLQRGALGAAGEIGHIRVRDGGGAICRCGSIDCLEAVASAWALLRQLEESGRTIEDVRDLAQLVRNGDPEVLGLIRTAGRRLGEILAGAVNLLNPAVIVIGGDLAGARDPLMAGVREAIYQQSTSAATRDLRVVSSGMVKRAGVTGCAAVALDYVLSPKSVDAAIARRAGAQSLGIEHAPPSILASSR